MEIKANAKINLCLDVVKRRDDGYHEMNMVMVPLALHDTLFIEKSDQDELLCDIDIPMDESNTIIKALHVMRQEFGFRQCFKMKIIKKIPMQAGMAGGSADGAATMRGIWELLQLPCTLEQLALLGKKVGADVPFCIINECALVQGIGEHVTRFKNQCNFHVLLVKPMQGVSTKEAFQTLDFTNCTHPDTLSCKKYLEEENYEEFYEHSGNTLEQSAFRLVPEIREIKREIEELGFEFVLMSGSGSTIFGLTRNVQVLKKGYTVMNNRFPFVEMSNVL